MNMVAITVSGEEDELAKIYARVILYFAGDVGTHLDREIISVRRTEREVGVTFKEMDMQYALQILGLTLPQK